MRILTVLIFAVLAHAQAPVHETIVVTGTADPLPLAEIDRSVLVLPVRELNLLANSLADLLRLDASLDLLERGPNGIQADVSIRGGAFGQTLFLLNGLRLNDAQSAHHNMDMPLPPEAIARVEVLHGSGSTLYGSDAAAGVVNFITEAPKTTEVRLRTAGGNLGVNQERGSVGVSGGGLAEHLTFAREFSSGFRPDRDYRTLAAGSTTYWRRTAMVLGYVDKRFGADQFYGNFNSWEDTKAWFASLSQAIGEKTQAAFAYRRHSDLFVLYRDRPQVYTNHHVDETWEAALRRKESPAANTSVHYGIEGFHESIVSNNLGVHARNRMAGYASADFRALRRFSLSLGAREEVYRSYSGEFSPSVSGGVWITPQLKLRASASRAFRVPTYTDLYYRDPANIGNPLLRPERTWTYEGGLDWNAGGRLRASVAVFNRRERDGIDYVRLSPAEPWRADNIAELSFTGVEASGAVRAGRDHLLEFRYTGLRGVQAALGSLQSRYIFNYPSQSAVASWQARLPGEVLVRTRLGALKRRGRDPYAVWDLYAACARGRVHPFLQLTNITATRYEEIAGIAMPGRAVLGGVEIVAFRKR